MIAGSGELHFVESFGRKDSKRTNVWRFNDTLVASFTRQLAELDDSILGPEAIVTVFAPG